MIVGAAEALFVGIIVCLASRAPANSETLADAIAFAYQTNPTLQSQRAQLRAIDESYVQARSGFGPSVQIQVTASYTQQKLGKSNQEAQRVSDPNPPAFIEQNSGDANFVVNQPLYTGGRTEADVKAAEARIRASREALRATEGNVLLAVIQSFSDVIRDQQALDVRRTSVQMLVEQVREIEARKAAGEVTRTDVAQAQAQLASERALYATAQGQLEIDRTAYTTVVGRNPGELAPEPSLPNLPQTIDKAFDTAEALSPDLYQARWAEVQSRDQIVVARAANRPSVSFRASYGYDGILAPYEGRNYDRALTGEAVLTQPIFTSGLNSSLIRQAVEQNTSDRIGIESARRTMIQAVANAWNQRSTAQANLDAQTLQVNAAQIAFDGMKVEYRAGQRSTLDVLVAEETLRDAELALISARHDVYVGSATLLRYSGLLEARDLMRGTPEYDPTDHFRRVAQAGALPWEPIIAHIDAIASPAAQQHAIPAPSTASMPSLEPAGAGAAANIPLATTLPTVPIPGTVSPVASSQTSSTIGRSAGW
jgi:outer membrane protein